ncbi:putative tyrosine-protein kinase in cps region [Methylocystis sp. MJC1]|nr:putative tyrosine-protein kinase in cps region [Methylocystis sp. MJC1]
MTIVRATKYGQSPSRAGSAVDGGVLDLWREPSRRAYAIIDPGAVWLFLRRNFLRILTAAAVAAAAMFGASLFIFKKYTATAVVMIDPRSARVTKSGGVISNIGGDAIAIESLVQVAKGEGFLSELVDRLDLTKDPYFGGKGDTLDAKRLSTVEKLASKLTIARRGTTYVIDVTATTNSAEESARLANAAAKQLVADQNELRTGANSTTAQEIEARLAELRGRVNRAEEAAAQLKARLKVTDAGEGNTLLERRIAELNQQLVLAGAGAAEARARFEILRKAGANAGESLPQSLQSSLLATLRGDYARLSGQLADQATVLGPRHPEVLRLNAQIADLRRQITAEFTRMVASAKTAFLEAQEREADLSRQMKAAQTESGELGPQMVKLGELEREAKAERDVYEELLNRQRELSQVKGLEPSDIRIVSPATPPTKTSPSRILLAIASAVLGLIAGLAYAIAREWRQTTLRTTSQAERLGGAEVLGFLPRLAPSETKDRSDDTLPNLTPWLAEICADITPEAGDGESVILLISSTRRGEGRSTIAANIAVYLSQGGDRVLLIEADKAEHGGNSGFGLLDILDSGEDLRSALVDQASAGYTFLPYGGRTVGRRSSVGGLMSGMTLRATLNLARRWFDVIVIDGPPALEAPHARFLAAQADKTLFIVEWDKTSAEDADAALDRLDLNEVAVVYNKADAKRLRLYDPEQSQQLAGLEIAA